MTLQQLAGLQPAGVDESGEIEYVGSNKQWETFMALDKAVDNGMDLKDLLRSMGTGAYYCKEHGLLSKDETKKIDGYGRVEDEYWILCEKCQKEVEFIDPSEPF